MGLLVVVVVFIVEGEDVTGLLFPLSLFDELVLDDEEEPFLNIKNVFI